MMTAILYHERLNFVARGPALIVVAVIVLAFGYAGWSGDRWRDARLAGLEAFDADKTASLEAWRAGLIAIENGQVEPSPYDANPMSISFPAILPPSALGDFAIGHANLHPASGEITPWRDLSSIFGRYQFDNPSMLTTGSFDMALVVILLMPILMIAVSFDILAAERNRGSLAMVLSAPVRLTSLVWTRLLFRNGVLWVVGVLVMTGLLVLNGSGGDRYARFGLWLATSLVYAFFWIALMALCIARFRSATQTAAALVGLWLLFTLAVPGTVATITEATYPTPSRLAYLSEVREAKGETNRNLASLTEGFLMDHPELSVGEEGLPSFYRAAFLSNETARVTTRPITEGYERARHGRAEALQWAQYLSPAIITQRLLSLAAGSDLGRQHEFQAQAREALFHLADAVGPAVVSRNRLSVAEFDALLPFAFKDRKTAELLADATTPLIFLILLGAIMSVMAHRRLDSKAGAHV